MNRSSDSESPRHRVLILGASYGSLLASKLLLAGHSVQLVARADEAERIERDGIRVNFAAIDLDLVSRNLPGELTAVTPPDADPRGFRPGGPFHAGAAIRR